MKKFVTFTLNLLLWCLTLLASAQNTRFYDKEDIGAQTVHTFCKDSYGFIWIGTEYGLRRFDGTEFVGYYHDEQDSNSLCDNEVRVIFIDRDRNLWVGTANGLQRYLPDEDCFQTVGLYKIAQKGYITSMIQRANGDLLFNASGIGVFRLDPDKAVAYKLDISNRHIHPRDFYHLYEDHLHDLWVSDNHGGIIRISATTGKEQFYSLQSASIKSILEDRNNELYIVTNNSVYHLDQKKNRFHRLPYHGEKKDYIFSKGILTYSADILLSTNGMGLMQIKSDSKTITDQSTIYNPFVDINRTQLPALFEDDKQNLWMSCCYQGILMQPNAPMPFHFWNQPHHPTDPPGSLKALFYCANDSSLWCSVENNGIYQMDQNGKQLRHIRVQQPVSSLYEDSNGTFWAGIDGKGLYRLNPRTGQLTPVYPIQGDNIIRGITEDRNKNLYASILGKGLLRYHLPTGKAELICHQTPLDNKQELINFWIFTICCDSQGRIWTGHYGGVSCYDTREKRFVKLPGKLPVRQTTFYCIMESHDHKIWMGTRKGLYCYDPGSQEVQAFTTAEGLPDNFICGLVEDRWGALWCSTTRGICHISPDTREITNYYTGNGLENKSYIEGQYTQSPDGIIYFGGYKGITSFYPADIKQIKLEHAPVITGLSIRDQKVTTKSLSGNRPIITKPLTQTDQIRLSHQDNSFVLTVSTMDYKDAKNILYEYRLKDFGDTWSKTQPGENHIQYHHLPTGGKYTLEIRACENGVYSPVKKLSISIAAPWFMSTWAKLVYTLIALGICYLTYITIRRKQRETIGEMKLQFFINIAHEIRSPLTLIVNPLESMMRKDNDAETAQLLQTVYLNANRILTLLNQLLDIRKIDKGQMLIHCTETDMTPFIAAQMEYFKSQARQSHIRLTFQADPDLPHVWIDRKYFDKVLMNLLSNAFKYTPDGGEICIQVTTGTNEHTNGPLRHYLEIVISDTGKGLNEKELKKIFERFYQSRDTQSPTPIGFGIGLNLCYSLVKLHHGVIFAANRTDRQGSKFTVRLPLGCKHLKKDEIETEQPTALSQQTVSQEIRQSEPVPNDPEPAKGKKPKTHYRILLIDDDEDLRTYLKENLSATYHVETAPDGNIGWKKAVTEQPDIIISDVVMPGMDGFLLLKSLKSNINTNHIPIVLLTSKIEFAQRIEGLKQGADGYLAKPFNLEELKALIANLLANRIRLRGKFSGSQTQTGKLSVQKVQSNDEILMERIMKIIDAQLSSPELNVEALAQEVGISRTQLHRRIKEITGLTPSDFIRNLRLQQATRLMKQKSLNVTEVAYAVGFTSPTHFATAFRKVYGITPKEYIESANAAKVQAGKPDDEEKAFHI